VTTTSSDQQENKGKKSRVSGELARKITKGDDQASNEFITINYRWLLFIVRRKFSRSNNHEDIVQDTFMLVIGKLKQGLIHNPNAIMAYLRTAAINIGFEYLRKDQKYISAVDQDMLTSIEDSKPGILPTLIWDNKLSYVKQAIAGLKKQRDREILSSFYFKGQDKPAICEKLQLSVEHFDRVLYRAKKRLKKLVDKSDYNKPNGPLKPLKIKQPDNKNNKDSSENSGKDPQDFVSKIICSIQIWLRKIPKVQRLFA
jgi:RNA polymerase sigma-70 factor (ECF subfamily)